MQQLDWPNGSRVLWMAKSNICREMTAKNRKNKRGEDKWRFLKWNALPETSLYAICCTHQHHAHEHTNKLNVDAMVFFVLLLLHFYICPHKNLRIPFLMMSSIQSEYHKILAQQHRRCKCTCAIVQIDIEKRIRWFSLFRTLSLSLSYRYWLCHAFTWQKTRSKKTPNDKFQFFCSFVISI